MARVIGIDYGKQRVGIAVTDPLQFIATPLKVVKNVDIFPFLKTYLHEEAVEAVVVGRPLRLQGDACEMTRLVDEFVLLFKKRFPGMPIFTFDERFTSVMAQASRVEGGFKKKARQDKGVLDIVSATFILRSFLIHYQSSHKVLKPL